MVVGSSQEGAGEEEGQHCAASQPNSACSETFAQAQASGPGGGIGFGFAINTASASQRLRHITKSVPVQNVAPPCRGGLPAPPHGGGQGPTSSRVPERSARPSLPPSPLFCASASVCGCPLSPVRQYMLVSPGSPFPFCPHWVSRIDPCSPASGEGDGNRRG